MPKLFFIFWNKKRSLVESLFWRSIKAEFINQNPEHQNALNLYGKVLEETKDYSEAIETLKKLKLRTQNQTNSQIDALRVRTQDLHGSPREPAMICTFCGFCQHGNFAQVLFEGLGGKREAFTIFT